MKAYTNYSSTEIPWVNQLPSHWGQIRNGGIFDYHQIKVGKDYREFDLLSLTTQGIRCKSILDAKGKVPASYEGYQVVNPGDMVFCLFDLDCSAVFSGLSKYKGMITSAYDVMKPREYIVNPQYLDYWFQSVFSGRYYKIYAKSVRYTINYDIFKALKTPVPPRAEQDQIVRFLDWKVSQIDRLIAGYQKEIELLKERRVTIIDRAVTKGIDPEVDYMTPKAEWMGAVPAQWKSCRMKNIFTEINIRSIDGSEPHLSMSQKKGLITDEEMKERRLLSENYIGGKVCEKDDLVLNRLKAHLGVFALAPQKGVVSPDYTVLRLKQDMVIPKYAEYLLKSNACRKELRIRVRGIVEGFWRLYTEDLGAIPVCLPDLPEQAEILNYISFHEKRIDAAIEGIDHQISLLREYRTRLICDAVTGQIDVRDVVIPEGAAAGDAPVFCNGTDEGEVGMDADEY